jgi:hypothetical protein
MTETHLFDSSARRLAWWSQLNWRLLAWDFSIGVVQYRSMSVEIILDMALGEIWS